ANDHSLTMQVMFDEQDLIPPGEYAASVRLHDSKTNTLKTADFVYKIKDTQPPVIEIEKEMIKVKYGEQYDPETNILNVYDVVDGKLDYTIEHNIDTKKPDNYPVKVSATDINGNTSVLTFNVKVSDPSGYSFPIQYSDGSSTITITKEWYGSSWNYIAHLQFSNYTRFGTAVGKGVYGGKETTSSAAKRLGALLTVNGCYSAPNLNYRVVRKGVIYNGADTNAWIPAVYSSHNGLLLSAWETGGTPGIAGVNLKQLVNEGKVTDTFNFGPPILVNGVVKAGGGGGRAQRTTIGTSGAAGDIWLVVSDGRHNDGVSSGPTYTEVAELLQSKGCTFAVPLDGGGSSTMVWRGTVLNAARGNQRAVVDFVYFK
ncbi:MAG: phosphodiester glycosidase family protein, partial [Erysipelotrichaceae bacterium]|nr:phosphodiester glycosidase family protein [Erysipelotrichaceae bacterium]